MANGGLRSAREALLLAYGTTNVIDCAEFAVFYDTNSSREFFFLYESYFLTGNSTNLTLRTGTIPSAERNYDSAKQTSSYFKKF